MLDFSFGELLLLAVIALVVLGPEKLPHAARMAGAWVGRIRRGVLSIQTEIEREVAAQEMRERIEKEVQRVRDADRNIRQDLSDINSRILDVKAETADAFRSPTAQMMPLPTPASTTPDTTAPLVPEQGTPTAGPEEKPGEEAFKAFVQSGQARPADKIHE
jgi:sec-independent protein translocase protein TatB